MLPLARMTVAGLVRGMPGRVRRSAERAFPRSPIAGLVARRLLITVPVVLGVSVLAFSVLQLLPGSAAQQLLGADATQRQVALLEAELDLNGSPAARYWKWMTGLLRGDLGRSLASGQSTAELLRDRLPVTLELLALALLFALGMALVVALLAARSPHGALDKLSAGLSMVAVSMPSYVFGLLLVLGFAIYVRWFPSIGFVPLSDSLAGNVKSLTLPAVALGFPFFGLYTRFLRGDLLDQIKTQGYVVFAKAKGLGPWRVLLLHALPNSLFGLITVIGLNLGSLIGGAVIIEQMFGLPGIGKLLLQALATRDLAVVQGIVLMTAVFTVMASLCVDLLYVLLDPRIRHARG